jgi:hypothetical protein
MTGSDRRGSNWEWNRGQQGKDKELKTKNRALTNRRQTRQQATQKNKISATKNPRPTAKGTRPAARDRDQLGDSRHRAKTIEWENVSGHHTRGGEIEDERNEVRSASAWGKQ